jgi:hypothetical protein
MAGTTGLEPATSAVTGQRSNQLSYVPSEYRTLELPCRQNRRLPAESLALHRLTAPGRIRAQVDSKRHLGTDMNECIR